jgi:SAM-dependent methyltransferase
MPYVHSLPTSASFETRGILGYTFGPLNDKDLEIYYIEVVKGHDTFMISRKISRFYYILSGSGYFTIADRRYDVIQGMLVEVPTKVEYSYSGQMTLLAFCTPRWFSGNETFTKWNSDVVDEDIPCPANSGSRLIQLAKLKVFGKSPVGIYLRLNQKLWDILPALLTELNPMRRYGKYLHALACIQSVRGQAFSTYFLRNRPMLELMGVLLTRTTANTLRVAVLGCSTGAEVYSIAWRIKSARPDVKLILNAVDISERAVEVGKRGVYSLVSPGIANSAICERMTLAELDQFFDRDRDSLTVRSWIKEGIRWSVGDVRQSTTLDALGLQDMVVANNFLCHMDNSEAEKCIRNIARLVNPPGYLFVSGINLDLRTRIANELGWNPLQESLEEIHEGDPCMRSIWPCHYAGLEPLDKSRPDWRLRYASAFHLKPSGERAQCLGDQDASVPPNLALNQIRRMDKRAAADA